MTSTTSQTPGAPARSHALDELIMGTNSSSIVSKRSVERLYYPHETHYFRHFVQKFQRRAPLINRGYWLRLKAIDVVVKQFLSENASKKSVVINLGCGSDVLPWQSHLRYASLCSDVLFVDVDYPDLMVKKRSIVLETPELRDILGENFVTNESAEDQVLLRSDRYCQIGCDLRELPRLRESLESLGQMANRPVLFVAEVSITYMDTRSADALIHWASGVGKAEFCLLEQLLPNGLAHPFAATMLSHFNKLKTPPKSVGQYATIDQQTRRFANRGYSEISIWDLWEAWSSEKFVSSSEKASLDEIEPFDEWEEFVLFCRHYFVIHASTTKQDKQIPNSSMCDGEDKSEKADGFQISITRYDVQAPKRRFGDALALVDPTGATSALHLMGIGTAGRAESCDIYSLDGPDDGPVNIPVAPIVGPIPRMCHTLTDLGDYGTLLAGGRTSPANALSDCWIFSKGSSRKWTPAPSLPIPLFRHATIRLPGSSLALVVGGKTGSSTISQDCYVFHAARGWLKCEVLGDLPTPVFGAILCNSSFRQKFDGKFVGLLAGGIGPDGRISSKKYIWHLEVNMAQPIIRFNLSGDGLDPDGLLSVFGARTIDIESQTLVCGGVGARPEWMGQNFLAVDMPTEGACVISKADMYPNDSTLPFMIGASIMQTDNSLWILGGGATCFSMGTFWETGIFQVHLKSRAGHDMSCQPTGRKASTIQYLGSQKVVSSSTGQSGRQAPSQAKATVTTIPRVRLRTPTQFNDILQASLPVIIEQADFGDCIQKWTPSYMISRVGCDTKVVVHECKHDTERMDFNLKNFRYATESFGKVMARAEAGERVYLRALSQAKPSELPANIREDFPGLAGDFSLPKEMDLVNQSEFSSVLRVSGRTNMWLHYDVMANIYAQVAGSKRMVLFPPRDVGHLLFAPGASSSSLDVFSELESSTLAATHPYEAMLEPGDMLFLPPCWSHTAATISAWSVAVNVFFRDLDNGYAAGRDVYGNRDLAAYEKGRQEVTRIGRSFQNVPLETRRFYLKRLADELELMAEGV